MALMNCPECGKGVSDQAQLCPNCGVAINNQPEPTLQPRGQSNKTLISQPYKRNNLLLVIISLIIFVPLGVGGIIFSFFIMPIGLITFIFSFLILCVGFVPLVAKAKAACPHCGGEINVTKATKIFKCSNCKRKISKINDYLEAI